MNTHLNDLPRRIRQLFPNAKTVSDAKESRSITVTGKDRRAGVSLEPNACALAVACKREWKVDGVWIGRTTAYVLQGTHLTRYMVPVTVARELTTFDRHSDFSLGIYRLSKIRASYRLGQSNRKAPYGKKGSKPRIGVEIPRHLTTRLR